MRVVEYRSLEYDDPTKLQNSLRQPGQSNFLLSVWLS